MTNALKMTLKVLIAAGAALLLIGAAPAPVMAKDLVKTMQQDLGDRRPKGCPHKWCACYLDIILEKAGYDIRGSWRARDFANYGKEAKPMSKGSIMVMKHHVGVVAGMCEDGRKVKLISGNHSKKVAIGCYSPKKAIAWRKPVRS